MSYFHWERAGNTGQRLNFKGWIIFKSILLLVSPMCTDPSLIGCDVDSHYSHEKLKELRIRPTTQRSSEGTAPSEEGD